MLFNNFSNYKNSRYSVNGNSVGKFIILSALLVFLSAALVVPTVGISGGWAAAQTGMGNQQQEKQHVHGQPLPEQTGKVDVTDTTYENYQDLKKEAERLYGEGSYQLVHVMYEQVKIDKLTDEYEQIWVKYRLADTAWRSHAVDRSRDDTELLKARKQFEELLAAHYERSDQHDNLWAEIQLSLADSYRYERWGDSRYEDWHKAWSYYKNALDYWAASTEIEIARAKYIGIVKNIAIISSNRSNDLAFRVDDLDITVLENAAKLADKSVDNREDRVLTHFMLVTKCTQLLNGKYALLNNRIYEVSKAGENAGVQVNQQRGGILKVYSLYYGSIQKLHNKIHDEFKLGLKLSKDKNNIWYDDILYGYADWLATFGKLVRYENGSYRFMPDYVAAAKYYQQIIDQYKSGQTRYYENAKRNIENITTTRFDINVANTFLPGSEIQFNLSWRNLDEVNFKLYKVEPGNSLKHTQYLKDEWLNALDLTQVEIVKTWDRKLEGSEEHIPGNDYVHLDNDDKPLSVGAYILEASAEGVDQNERELILVTDLAIVTHEAENKPVVYVCNAITGAPVPGADVIAWTRAVDNNNKKWVGEIVRFKTNEDGLGYPEFDWNKSNTNSWWGRRVFMIASSGDKHAVGSTEIDNYRYDENNNNYVNWKIYAFTDRPAYRPGETVNWKIIARTEMGDSIRATPAGKVLNYEVRGPQGNSVTKGEITLNDYGSAWATLDLDANMPLGEYTVTFNDEHTNGIGSATIFRLEEYKLPEFMVTVETPKDEVTGKPIIFRVGDEIEAVIKAAYYFGGAVANADVEIVIKRKVYNYIWQIPREFPWCYENNFGGRWDYGSWWDGEEILRETLKTDAEGKAVVHFDSTAGSENYSDWDNLDSEYTIEARVTDASRREINGSGKVRVTQHSYFVNLRSRHYLYEPGEKVEFDITVKDANEEAVAGVEGKVRVTREYWREIWISPAGIEVKGEELERAKDQYVIFPPVPDKDGRCWKPKHRDYVVAEEDYSSKVITNDKGEASITFTPKVEGYYKAEWVSEDEGIGPIIASSTVWICDDASRRLGYSHDGVEIIIDKDTFRVGDRVPVLISVDNSNRYVLLMHGAKSLDSVELIHIQDSVKLVWIEVPEKYVPNFYISALSVFDTTLDYASAEVNVPPVEEYLSVEVVADREVYDTRDEGSLTVIARDQNGKPVESAEVAVGFVDESVYYIQSDYAGDPRKFFFRGRNWFNNDFSSSFNENEYVRLVKHPFAKDKLVNEKDLEEVFEEVRNWLDKEGIKYDDGEIHNYFSLYKLGEEAESLMFNDEEAYGFYEGGSQSMYMRSDGGAPSRGRAAGLAAAESDAMFDKGISLGKSVVVGGELIMSDTFEPEAGGDTGGGGPAVEVRSDFRSTILWLPDVITDKNGKAVLKVDYPDNVTKWKTTARATTKGYQFGIADTATRTRKPLIVRLQAPRFFVVGDEVTISAIINNNTDEDMTVEPILSAEGGITISKFTRGIDSGKYTVAANSEQRVDWFGKVENTGKDGLVKLQVTAKSTGEYADAMVLTYPVYEHGIDKFVAKSGKTIGDDTVIIFDIPAERKVESTALTINVTPSLAVSMLDALPYLLEYPYGCTEQTVSRFVPAVVTLKTLRELGLDEGDVVGHMFGGIEKEFVDETHKKNKRTADLDKLDKVIAAGLERLFSMQHGDGGWGWWKLGNSDHYMTAYVVWGLALAKDAGVEGVDRNRFESAVGWLQEQLVKEENNVNRQVWLLHALSAVYELNNDKIMNPNENIAFKNAFTKRSDLSSYGIALLAIAADKYDKDKEARILVDNLKNGIKIDNTPDTSVITKGGAGKSDATVISTAHWGEDGWYYRWYDGAVETTAFALQAMLAVNPKDEMIEPVLNWLNKNRRGGQWSNTRDTAITVIAFNEYLQQQKETITEEMFEILVNGKAIGIMTTCAPDLLTQPNTFIVEPNVIVDGKNEIRIVRHRSSSSDGDNNDNADSNNSNTGSPIYFTISAEYFTYEEPVTPAGHEIFVRRDYYKLVPKDTLLKGPVYERVPLLDNEEINSGERVEVVLTIETKNDYEYLIFEDLKPAGFEAVQIRSGESLYARQFKSSGIDYKFGVEGEAQNQSGEIKHGQTNRRMSKPGGSGSRWGGYPEGGDYNRDYTGRSSWVYQELRDRKVALFIGDLPQGVWEIKYDLRAEVPGKFHALPVLGHAMYVPEIRCNGSEVRVVVNERVKQE